MMVVFLAFPSRSKGPSCACPDRQHIGGLLYKPPGGSVVAPTLQTGALDPPLGPGEAALPEGSFYSWTLGVSKTWGQTSCRGRG